jgi:hypothetical protein
MIVVGAAIVSTTGAAAAPLPQRQHEAIGSMELGNPLQYETFLALQSGRNHGDVDYTNWTYTEAGSGVWAPASGSHALVFTYQGSPYSHTLNNGLTLVAMSPDRLAFSGSGEYGQAGATATWAISGHVTDGSLGATITYNGTLTPGYKVTLSGMVATDGSVSGTALSSTGQALTFTMPAGTFVSVLHYVAPFSKVQVQGHDATLQFTIPASVPGLAGTRVTVKVHDGGPGARHDTYAAGVTGTRLIPYPIIDGPGVTVK